MAKAPRIRDVASGRTDMLVIEIPQNDGTAVQLGQASDSEIGLVELATSAEAILGADTARVLTPAGMRADLTRWNDINFPGANLGAGASAPDLVTLFGAGNVLGRAFDGNATTEQLYSSDELLHGYVEGSNIYFHIHWMPTTAEAGNVKWQLEYSWVNAGAVAAAPTTISATVAAAGAAWTHQMTTFTAINGEGKKIGSQFAFRLFRNPSDAADTYEADAALLSCGIHYQVDATGSREVGTK